MTARDPHLGPALDAIVVTWSSAPDLEACLTALPGWVRVLVVDNRSPDDSVAVARRLGASVRELPENVGFPRAVNAALPEVSTAATLLLNPDLVVGDGCIERCLAELESDPTIGVVGPATTDANGQPEPAAARHDRTAGQIVLESLGVVHLSRRFDRQMVRDRDRTQDVDAVNGAFLLIRTELLRDLGGLDEAVFMYLEDADLCRRVRDRGLRVRFVADAPAVHGGGTSTARGDDASRARAYLHRIDGDLEFLRRHGRRWEPPVAALAFAVRALVGLVVTAASATRRARYRAALPYAVRQLRGRRPAPPV